MVIEKIKLKNLKFLKKYYFSPKTNKIEMKREEKKLFKHSRMSYSLSF